MPLIEPIKEQIRHRLFDVVTELMAILGGALGNLTDRMISGEVTDFLDLHWRGYYWPAFNIADSCITTGMIILLLHSFLVPERAGDGQQA